MEPWLLWPSRELSLSVVLPLKWTVDAEDGGVGLGSCSPQQLENSLPDPRAGVRGGDLLRRVARGPVPQCPSVVSTVGRVLCVLAGDRGPRWGRW